MYYMLYRYMFIMHYRIIINLEQHNKHNFKDKIIFEKKIKRT